MSLAFRFYDKNDKCAKEYFMVSFYDKNGPVALFKAGKFLQSVMANNSRSWQTHFGA